MQLLPLELRRRLLQAYRLQCNALPLLLLPLLTLTMTVMACL
jgi:hypothetical protein